MLRKTLFLTFAAILVVLATSSKTDAWYCYHYHTGYGGYGGGFHVGGYDRYGGGYHYGDYDRYGGYGGYHYGGYHYGGYGGGGYHYGYYRRY
jgi:hypothetical protein